jgi:hypothetical protein
VPDQGETALIDPGKPWQNGVGESFNGKFRDECLSLEWFLSRAQAKVAIEGEVRPHSSLGYLTPPSSPRSSSRPTQLPLPQRGGTLRDVGASRPGPLQSKQQKTPVLSS